MRYSGFRIGVTQKITLVVAVAAVAAGLASMTIGLTQSSKFADAANEESTNLASARFDAIAVSSASNVATIDATLQQKLGADVRVGQSMAEQMGGFRLGLITNVSWTAVNQFDQSTVDIELQEMRVGREWLGQVSNPAEEAPFVDDVFNQLGAISTVFQRMNAPGDMLRVSTNVAKTDGTRAIGTYIPAINPDKTPNAVVSTVLAGETYIGTAFVVNRWYITAYAPIFDIRGEVVGSFFVGLPQDTVTELQDSILGTDVGENGSMTVIRASGGQRGDVVFGPDSLAGTPNIGEALDLDGRPYIAETLDAALELEPGEVGRNRFRLEDVGTVTAHFAYYERCTPGDWQSRSRRWLVGPATSPMAISISNRWLSTEPMSSAIWPTPLMR